MLEEETTIYLLMFLVIMDVKMGCKFCWLTNQSQTNFVHSSLDAYDVQLKTILQNVPDKKATRVNINFMARGEPLANKHVINNYHTVYSNLNNIVKSYSYEKMKINMSTILPKLLDNKTLFEIFGETPVNLYYSLYSVNDTFRSHWMPNALPWEKGLDKLIQYQKSCKETPVISFHWTFIEGHNDNIKDVEKIANEIKKRGFLRTKFNLVRFNPHPTLKENEPSIQKLNELFSVIQNVMTEKVNYNSSRIVPRAGPDVFASCGMFANEEDL